MNKKNPLVTTIGFNKDDPDHVYVAEFLNSIGKGKARYIVKAVLTYQEIEKNGGQHYPAASVIDYEGIRRIVLQVLEERDRQAVYAGPVYKEPEKQTEPEPTEEDILDQFGDDELDGIMAALAAFQEQ